MAALFSVQVTQPALEVGDTGILQILYDSEPDNFTFANGGISLNLSSSRQGVIQFTAAQVNNDKENWALVVARDISSDSVGELRAFSVLTPGFVESGTQLFAQIEYTLLGTGFTELSIDVEGEDPLYDGTEGDVSSNVFAQGLCLGECNGVELPERINLGERLAAQIAAGKIPAPFILEETTIPACSSNCSTRKPTPAIPSQPSSPPTASPPVTPAPPSLEEPIEPPPVSEVVENPVELDLPGEIRVLPYIDLSEYLINVDWMPRYTPASGLNLVAFDGVGHSSRIFDSADGTLMEFGVPMNLSDQDSGLALGHLNVPEPATLVLVGLSMIGIVLSRTKD
ncbi:PEP-CTERM sorting domain-containing protein [Bythopirellula polymerisocia]|nr:PEP-CTERM sorting domain-containing protein [Bythopirellula polymerisocia]